MISGKEEITIIEPTVSSFGSGATVHLPIKTVKALELNGWVERGKAYITHSDVGFVFCTNCKSTRPYFLKRIEEHPPRCADCGVSFE